MQILLLTPGWPWASCPTSLCLIFLIYEVKVTIVISFIRLWWFLQIILKDPKTISNGGYSTAIYYLYKWPIHSIIIYRVVVSAALGSQSGCQASCFSGWVFFSGICLHSWNKQRSIIKSTTESAASWGQLPSLIHLYFSKPGAVANTFSKMIFSFALNMLR